MALRIARWAGYALLGLIALVAALILFLNTSAGKRFIINRLDTIETASGIGVHIGRIEGSIYGRMEIRDLRVTDTRGVFLTAPRVMLDWRPFAYLHKKIAVHELSARTVTLLRNPALKPTPPNPNAPILPNIDIELDRLAIGRLIIQPPVTGKRHIVRLNGSVDIAGGRARIALDADALKARGVAGGDRLALKLDAVPDRNRFALEAHVSAPAGGLMDSYAGLGKPLALNIHGGGDWAHWQGRARAELGGAQLADLAITGVDGTFHTTGTLKPGLMLGGPVARLTEPALSIDLTTRLAHRTSDTKLVARSDALAIDAVGLIDLAHNRLGDFHINARLLSPGAIAGAVRGRDVALAATMDGPFAKPTIDYHLTAGAIGFGAIGIEGLAAQGRATIDSQRVLIPVHATAGKVVGLSASLGGLVTHLRLDGDIAWQNEQIASDNLHIRSDRIDATATILADLAHGHYTGALRGRINDYQVQGLGRLNVVTDARLVPGRGGGFAIRGHVRARTTRIDNGAIAGQLGGNALIDADIGYDLSGRATMSNLRITAPRFRITSGHGSYQPNGRIALVAAGQSAAYGPFTLDVSGTIAKPQAHITAARPGLGLGLSGFDATLESGAGGYRVRAKGQSNYGPFTADVTLETGGGASRFRINSAIIAGVRFGGEVAQTPAGPYAGTLTLTGSGLNGTIRLSAAGRVQQADLDLRAQAARIPGSMPITIGSGMLTATVRLPQSGPDVEGRFSFADVRDGDLAIARAQGRITYHGGSGRVALLASGQRGVPFDLAAQAALSPGRVIANLKGTVNGLALHLAQPAVATKSGGAWTLAPVTVILPGGQVTLSGSYGAATSLHAALDNLDLSMANAFAPQFGLGGKASGTIDYRGGGTVPDLRARIDIAGFTRTGALTVSEPVDIALLATLDDSGGDARALIRRGGATIGRAVARLAPLGLGASLSERLAAAPLSGGIRYQGPAEVPWALTGIAGQQLSGPVAIGMDFGGRLGAPTLTGLIRASQLRYENSSYGTVLSDIALEGRFSGSQFVLEKLAAKAGSGTVSAHGTVGLDAASGYPIDLSATLANAQLARSDSLDATVSGTLSITNGKANGGLIKGDLSLPEVRYRIVRQGSAEVPTLTGVHRKGAKITPEAPSSSLPSNWKLAIRLHADNRVFVSGMGLEAEWRTDMQVRGTTAHPRVVGRIEEVRGTYSFAGRRFDIDHGIIAFEGQLDNPTLDISASATVEDITATVSISGTAQDPQVSFTSTPALPQDEVLSRILFGSSVTSLSPTQAIQLAAALNSLRGSGGGFNPLGKLRSVAGIDRLRVLGADEAAGHGTALAAGKYISNNIYVEIVTDARGFTATQLEISLTKALSILSQAGSFGGSNAALQYKKTY